MEGSTDARNERVGTFVQNLFRYLRDRGVDAVVLHGGREGFVRELSDIDFTVSRADFHRLPQWIARHCAATGWQLCQGLRHETTAAYWVCSAADDPGCAVALDACSDYQRNGKVFLKAEELLKDPVSLPWGGLEPADGVRWCYRFAKAAAKEKATEEVVGEFLSCSPEARDAGADWLLNRWGIRLAGWDPEDLSEALGKLRTVCRSRPSLWQKGSPTRILSRILRPTGMVVAADERVSARLAEDFGKLHFREVHHAPAFRPGDLVKLIRSHLLLVDPRSLGAARLLPGGWVLDLSDEKDPSLAGRRLADRLWQRCARREHLPRH